MVVSARAFKGRFLTVGISLLIVGVLILMLVTRVDREIGHLEQTRFEFRLAELRSALRVKQLEILAKGGRFKSKALFGANPMEWIEASPDGRPAQYLGVVELDSVDAEEARGNWAYDPINKVIAYLPRTPGGLDLQRIGGEIDRGGDVAMSPSGPGWVKFQVKPVRRGNRLDALLLERVP